MITKDMRKLEKAMVAQGFDPFTETKDGHLKATKGGVFVAMFSGSPSDHRSYKNSLADLRRAGFRPAGVSRKGR